MSDSIELDVQLRAFARRERRNRWIAICPKLDVVTQGSSAKDAKRQLDDAVRAWFEDCIDRGTLEQALRECGFRVALGEKVEALDDGVSPPRKQQHDFLGEELWVHVRIPAYQGAPMIAG